MYIEFYTKISTKDAYFMINIHTNSVSVTVHKSRITTGLPLNIEAINVSFQR